MGSRWSRGGIALAVVAMVAAGATRVAGRAQETPPPSPGSPAAIDDRVKELEQLVKDQQAELEKLRRAVAGLVDGSEKLSVAAEQALIKGFVSAGPNPDARVEILNGLSAFAESVRSATVPPEEEAEPPKK